MISRLRNYFLDLRDRQRVAIALARGGATLGGRRVNPRDPGTWEFCGFSQNGEDGIVNVLRAHLKSPNRYFMEIGSGDGIENNTAWLAIAERYSGLMIEADAYRCVRAARMVGSLNIGVRCLNWHVTPDMAASLVAEAVHADPDVLSLDIDGTDYYVAQALLDAGLRPKILAVEYNSVFGPERSMTIEYSDGFDFGAAHPSQLYYGVSISGWRTCLARRGYRFVCVERNGVNAFFVDPEHFDAGFLEAVRGLGFAENYYQLVKFRVPSDKQFPLISSKTFVPI